VRPTAAFPPTVSPRTPSTLAPALAARAGRGGRGAWAACAALALAAATGCASTIRVDGVMHDSPEMRPLHNVPGDAYKQVRVLVKPAGGDAQGGAECGHAPLEGTLESEDKHNTACLPPDAPNDAVRIVRQRLRAYGAVVAKDGAEPYDYLVEVRVQGVAPRQADRLQTKAAAKVTFTLRPDDATSGFFHGVDVAAAGAAFADVARDCALHDAELGAFSSSATTPMIPEFDMTALAGDAVDTSFGCEQLARFFRDVHTRFPKGGAPATP
jgi:hypothetical protein